MASGRRVVERLAVRARQVQRRPRDPVTPRLRVGPRARPRGPWRCGPRRRRAAAPGGDTSTMEVTHARRLPRPGADEQRLVEPERGDRPDAVGVLDQRGAVGDHGVHDGVPVTAELRGDRRDGLALRPTWRVIHRPARSVTPARAAAIAGALLGEGPDLTGRLRAAPPALVPHQHRRASERRQVHQRDRAAGPSPTPWSRTPRSRPPRRWSRRAPATARRARRRRRAR